MPLTKSVLERMRRKTIEAIRNCTDTQEIKDLKEELSSIEEQLRSLLSDDEEETSQGMSDEITSVITPLQKPRTTSSSTAVSSSAKSSTSSVSLLTQQNLRKLELSQTATTTSPQQQAMEQFPSPPSVRSFKSSSSRSSARSIRSAALKQIRLEAEDDLESVCSECSATTSQLDEEDRKIQLIQQEVLRKRKENERLDELLIEKEAKRQQEERILSFTKKESQTRAQKLEEEERVVKNYQTMKEEERRRAQQIQNQIAEAERRAKQEREQYEAYQLKASQERARLERQKVEQERLHQMRQEQFRQSDAYLQRNTRECPACGSAIIKIDGCDHVICPCGHKFNYSEARAGKARNFENLALNNTTFSLVIQLVNGKQHVASFNSYRPTVDELYTKAAALSGADVEVVFGGRTLARGSFLDNYNISNNSVVFCTYRVPGGGVEEHMTNVHSSSSRNASKRARREAQRKQKEELQATLQTIQDENEKYKEELQSYITECDLYCLLELSEDKDRDCITIEEQKIRSKLEYHSLKNQTKIYVDSDKLKNHFPSSRIPSSSTTHKQTPVIIKRTAMDSYLNPKSKSSSGLVDWTKCALQKIWQVARFNNGIRRSLYWRMCGYFNSYENKKDDQVVNGDKSDSKETEMPLINKVNNVTQDPPMVEDNICEMQVLGLPNHGNTCYQNAALQALLHCKGVVQYINESNANGAISSSFYDLCKQYHMKQATGIASCLESLRKRLGTSYYTDGSQQDSYQFMSDIISAIEREKSLVLQEFLGEMEVEQDCSHCGYSRITTQTFISVTLPIPQYGQPSLDSCFDLLFEHCEKVCEMCQFPCRISKRFKHLPRVVILHLNRFTCGQRRVTKNHVPLSNIPLQLREPLNGYQLESVVRHSGSISGGHYYTESLVHGQWYEFNDRMSYKTSTPTPNGTEYILVYTNYAK